MYAEVISQLSWGELPVLIDLLPTNKTTSLLPCINMYTIIYHDVMEWVTVFAD